MDCVSCVAQIEIDRDTNEWPGFIHLMVAVADDDEQLHDASSSVVTIQPPPEEGILYPSKQKFNIQKKKSSGWFI